MMSGGKPTARSDRRSRERTQTRSARMAQSVRERLMAGALDNPPVTGPDMVVLLDLIGDRHIHSPASFQALSDVATAAWRAAYVEGWRACVRHIGKAVT